MSNECRYEMKMIGSKESVSELAQILDRYGDFLNDSIGHARWFLVNSLEPTGADGLYALRGEGACARSVWLALQREGIEDRLKGTDREGMPFRSLEGESERLGVSLEIYSREPQMGFEEHLLIANGLVMEEKCITSLIVDAESVLRNLDAFNQKYGTSFTEQEVRETGVFHIGGYGERFGDFSALDDLARKDASLSEDNLPQAGEPGMDEAVQAAKRKAAEKNAERSDASKGRKPPEMGR